jgi:hypothetical protein
VNNPVIERLREARRTLELRIKQKAVAVYATFDQSERTIMRIGMFPAQKMQQAQQELIAELTLCDGEPPDSSEVSRMLAVGIMDAANAGADKLVV